jgi:hypothetical protein
VTALRVSASASPSSKSRRCASHDSASRRLARGVAGLALHELPAGGALHLILQAGFRHRCVLAYFSRQRVRRVAFFC